MIFSSQCRDRTIVTIKGFGRDISFNYFKKSISIDNDAEEKSNISKLVAK